MSTPVKIGFRVDAGAGIGGGHVYRCLALADALAGAGAVCSFITAAQSLPMVPGLEKSAHRVCIIDNPDGEPAQQAAEAGRLAGEQDAMVVDSYGLGGTFEQACRAWCRFVVAIDDMPGRAHDADLIVDTTYGREPEAYRDIAPGAVVLAGSEHALLRPGFAEQRQACLKRREQRGGQLEHLFVGFGAADPKNFTGVVLDVLAGIPTISGDVLVGAGNPFIDDIRARVAACGPHIELFEGYDDVAGLMSRADLAIGAAGSMSWERCSLGLPTLAAVLAGNQTDVIAALVSAGAALPLGDTPQSIAAELPKALSSLAGNPLELVRMSRAAAEVCDGRGAERVAEAIMSRAATMGR